MHPSRDSGKFHKFLNSYFKRKSTKNHTVSHEINNKENIINNTLIPVSRSLTTPLIMDGTININPRIITF